MKLPFGKEQIQLKRLLTIDDPSVETIFGVIGRMEILLDYFATNPKYKNLIPFLKTYYWVTKKAADKYLLKKHYFWNMRDYEQLDIYFATLYFKPLLAFLEKKPITKPWQPYFEYCQKKDGLPLLQIVLGINAHINADLFQALIELDYKNKNDFFLVNQVLSEIEPEVIRLLAKEHDLVGLSGLAFGNFIKSEFKDIIIRWRQEAWENAVQTNYSHQNQNYQLIIGKTQKVAGQLVLGFTSIYHLQHLPENIRELNKLSVKI